MTTINRRVLATVAAVISAPAFAQPKSTESNPELDQVVRMQMAAGQRQAMAEQTTSTAGDGRNYNDKKVRREVLEEVIVSAQKRTEALQDVPIAISVLSGIDLDRSVQSVSEALDRVPGITNLAFESGGNTLLSVRGVSAGSAFLNGASPVGYYLDSMPFGLVRSALAPDSNAYDLERVEVLRGPQGTLYGASAQNGVVRVLTKDANPDDVEIKLRAAGSSTHDGGENYRGDMVANLPIIEGKLAARAVVGYEDWSGWIDRLNSKDANDEQIRNYRLKIAAQPNEQLSIGVSAWILRSDSSARWAGTENRTHPARVNEPQRTDYDTYAFNIGYDFPAFSFSSTTSYLDYSTLGTTDLESSRGLVDSLLYTGLDSEVFSQEINLTSSVAGSWRWTAGGIFRDGKDHFFQWRRQYANPNGNRFSDESESFAIFGELTKLLFDGRFELTAGARYFEDDVTTREISRASNPAASPLIESTGKFDAVSPRGVLTWHTSAKWMTYLSYSEGFRSGFPQAPYLNIPGFPPVDSDNLSNYELGSKGTFWDGRASFEAAVFYIDWKNMQQQLVVEADLGTGAPTLVVATINGASASGAGVDIGFTVRPLSGLDLGLNASWNDLKFNENVLSGGQLIILKGDRLTSSPELTVGASVGYEFPLGGSEMTGRFSGSANYISERDTRGVIAGISAIAKSDNILLSQIAFSVNSESGWTGSVFVDNLNDETGTPVANFNPDPIVQSRLRPRTVGLQLEYEFR